MAIQNHWQVIELLFYFVAGITTGAYALMITAFWLGWLQLPDAPSPNKFSGGPVSVVIPFRNEAAHLPALLQRLHNQSLPHNRFEVLLVDDHSQDNSAPIARQALKKGLPGRLISLSKSSGKKAALHAGITAAKHPCIATTDADSLPHPNWLMTILGYFSSTRASLCLGIVSMPATSIPAQWQALEFSSLIASGAGAAGLDRPVMANGANLAFTAKAYWDVQEQLPRHIASGDDMFLLHALKKHPWHRIVFMKSMHAAVQTTPAANWRAFWQQRRRWTAKSPHYKDFLTILTALLVLGANLCLLAAFLYALLTGQWTLVAALFLIKSLPDALLLATYNRFLGQLHLLRWFIPLQLIYPVYIILNAFTLLFPRFYWKSRRHKA